MHKESTHPFLYIISAFIITGTIAWTYFSVIHTGKFQPLGETLAAASEVKGAHTQRVKFPDAQK